MPCQCRRRRFSIRSGNSNLASLQEPRGKLQFADNLNAARNRILEKVEVGWNAGRYDREVGVVEGGSCLRLDENAAYRSVRLKVHGADERAFFKQQFNG